jgi:hypothetical protein
MPARGDRVAPQFDVSQPRQLNRYWSDLEFLLNRAGIVNADERKKEAIRFVDVDTETLWRSLAEFQPGSTWDEYKAAVSKLYPGSEAERTWLVSEMDQLVGERTRLGIHSLADLGEFHRHFILITTYLISRRRLSEGEQSRAYARAFQPELWQRISQRLQIKLPDQHPDDPYDISAIHEAATFVLTGTAVTSPVQTLKGGSLPPVVLAPVKHEKIDKLTTMMETLAETFVKIMSSQAEANQRTNRGQPRPFGANQTCNMCGSADHFLRNCDVAQEYIRKGLCKRDSEGKVVLPSGAWIPREPEGKNMKERIDEYHRRQTNANGTTSSQMLLGVMANSIPENATVTIATRETHPNIIRTVGDTISVNERIFALEQELFALRNRNGQVAQKPNRRIEEDEEAEEVSRNTAIRKQPEVVIPVKRKAPEPKEKEKGPVRFEEVLEEEETPAHPFAKAQDGTYAPPQDRNIGATPKPPAARKPEPAYRTTAPVYDEKVASEVFNRSMEASITLSQRELLSLSPEVRTQYREVTSQRRIATKENAKIHTYANDDALPFALDDFEGDRSSYIQELHQPRAPPPGSIVIPDLYEQYLRRIPEGARKERLLVAKESSALRAILPIVDGQQKVEAILDPGSQIIAMSEEVCTDLALVYDPTIILNMQSANGDIDQSLGLARNVPFAIGEITVYLQCHIIRQPAYDILLGRPFDVLTESVVRNFGNEDQTITICDPNSGKRATVPTTARGPPRCKCEQDFRE